MNHLLYLSTLASMPALAGTGEDLVRSLLSCDAGLFKFLAGTEMLREPRPVLGQ